MSRLSHAHTHTDADTYVSYRCNCIRGIQKLVIYCLPACPARDTDLPQLDNPYGNATKITNAQGEAEKKKEKGKKREKQKPKCPKCLEMGQTKTETNPNEMAFTEK